MSFVSATIGRFMPKYRTLNEWLEIYSASIEGRQITAKTLQNRRSHVKRISYAFGDRHIGSILPHEINFLIAGLTKKYPVAAKRTLIEARGIFDEAITNGWITSNPARSVRVPRVVVKRRRLTLNEWKLIYDYSRVHQPPWVPRMILLALVTGQRRSDLVKMKFSDVWAHEDGVEYLHVAQAKTGARLAIPTALRLNSIGVSVGEAIEMCHSYSKEGDGYLIRKTTTKQLCPESMSWRFEQAREAALPPHTGEQTPASLHECRSLSAREYKKQGINTQDLLGHSKQAMTELYHAERGLDAREDRWKVVELPRPRAQELATTP